MSKVARALLGAALVLSTTVAYVDGGVATAAEPIPDDPSVPVASGTLLPFKGNPSGLVVAGDIVVDESHGHVFISGGRLESNVAVTDLDGTLVTTITGLAGADGMVLSADASTLYVGLAVAGAIAAVDTTTFDVSTYSTPDRCPRHLTQIDGAVYFTSACQDTWYDIARLDTVTGTVDPVVLAGEPDNYLLYAKQIVPDPVREGRFYVIDKQSSLFHVHAYELDSVGLAATRSATNDSFKSSVFGIDVSPDGEVVLAATPDGVVGLESTHLLRLLDHEATGYSVEVAAGRDYVASVGSQQVVITNDTGAYGRSFFFDHHVKFAFDSLAWGTDRLFGVAEDISDGSLRLYAFSGHSIPAPLLTFGGSPERSTFGTPLQWDVQATFSGRDYADQPLRVWRSGPDGLISLGQPSTGLDGRITIDDTPPEKGAYTYTLLYDGDPDTAPARLRWYHWVSGLATKLVFKRPPVFGPDETIVMTGRLTGPSASPVPDATVELTQTYGGQKTTLPAATTDADGNFSFETSGGSIGQYQFHGRYAGDGRYNESWDYETAWVKHRVVVDLATPAPYLVRTDPVTFHGTVMSDDGTPVAQQTVSWRRYAPRSTTIRKSGKVVTGRDGSFSFTDQYADRGPVRWEVVYGGDDAHDKGADEVTVQVYAMLPSVDITTDRLTYTYGQNGSAEVWIQDGSYGTVRLYAEPYGEPRKVVASGRTLSGRDLATELTLTRNTRLTAVFEPTSDTSQAAPNETTVSVSVRPVLAERLRGFYDKRGRTHLVHRDTDPRLTLQVTPRLPGRCVRVRVERYRDGAFRFVRRTRCISLNRYSRARWTLAGNPPAGARFRLRYEAPGDAAFALAKAPWTHLKFTR
jgi:hypothetical protein